MALAPARFELEMKPGTETTVVVDLDFKTASDLTRPARIVASLNDWNITRDGRVEFFPANTQANSASSWLIYSPGEAAVMPGAMHQIRVTIAVPSNATPGDHLAALHLDTFAERARRFAHHGVRRAGEARREAVMQRHAVALVFEHQAGVALGEGTNRLRRA